MERRQIQELYQNFLAYSGEGETKIWDEKSKEFREFWKNKIANNDVDEITESEIDQIIRILDNRAKGNTKESVAIARIMVPQGAWRRMFYEFKNDQELRDILTDLLNEHDEDVRMKLIDKLYEKNQGRKNNLTGPSANVVNAMLFAWNPTNHVSVVSLNDRKKVIEYFSFSNGPDFENDSIGKKVVLSNRAIIDGFKGLGISSHPRTLSKFLYTTLLNYWKPEVGKIKIEGKEVQVSIPEKDETEVIEKMKTSDIRESLQIQAKIAQIGETLGYKIWLPKSDRNRVKQFWKPNEGSLLEELPMAFDESVLKIIKNIDVLWIKKAYISRAFEVEGETSIISGILRMGDLMAVLPNLNIRTYLVTRVERRDEVSRHVNRPVFADINSRKLSDLCYYLSYDSVNQLANEEKLRSMKDTVVDDYAEDLTLTENRS